MAAVDDSRMFDSPYNVIAGFRNRVEAQAAARRLASAGLSGATVELASPASNGRVEQAELRADMQSELSGSWGGATGRQAQWAAVGSGMLAAAGLFLGAVVGLIVGLGPWDAPIAGTILLGAVIGAVAGWVIGLIGGGGLAPRAASAGSSAFDDPKPLAERDILLAVHATEAATAERAARMLKGDLHADRVDLFDAAGTPLPPQAGNPRPADPEGYWWKEAGQG